MQFSLLDFEMTTREVMNFTHIHLLHFRCFHFHKVV